MSGRWMKCKQAARSIQTQHILQAFLKPSLFPEPVNLKHKCYHRHRFHSSSVLSLLFLHSPLVIRYRIVFFSATFLPGYPDFIMAYTLIPGITNSQWPCATHSIQLKKKSQPVMLGLTLVLLMFTSRMDRRIYREVLGLWVCELTDTLGKKYPGSHWRLIQVTLFRLAQRSFKSNLQ